MAGYKPSSTFCVHMDSFQGKLSQRHQEDPPPPTPPELTLGRQPLFIDP